MDCIHIVLFYSCEHFKCCTVYTSHSVYASHSSHSHEAMGTLGNGGPHWTIFELGCTGIRLVWLIFHVQNISTTLFFIAVTLTALPFALPVAHYRFTGFLRNGPHYHIKQSAIQPHWLCGSTYM